MQSMYTDMEMSRTVLAGYAPMAAMSIEDLMAGYETRQVAYLDLRKMRVKGTSNLINIGPNSCLAGDLSLEPEKPGTSQQVCSCHHPELPPHGTCDLQLLCACTHARSEPHHIYLPVQAGLMVMDGAPDMHSFVWCAGDIQGEGGAELSAGAL